jgi:saccharopine dehydrogenase-like NADP-dependent oxidoreductase
VKVLLVGVGTVGEAIVRLSRNAPWLERLVCADYDVGRARRVRDAAGADESTHPAIALDASSQAAIVEAIRAHDVDIVVNAVDPRFVMPIFDAALEADVDYLDLAMSLSQPHPDRPHEAPGTMLGDVQFGRDAQWRERGRLALCGMGMDPGLSDVFATYAARHLFDEVHAVRIRDGGDLRVEGHAFAPVFSIWTTIEECLNPPLIWEKERGWFTTEPFSEPERFVFPDGIGPVECVNVEHEEVVLVPRWLDVRRVDFKYALGEDFIGVLKTLHRLGLDRTDKVDVRGVQVAPRDLVGALTPDPATLGDAFVGRASWGRGSPACATVHHARCTCTSNATPGRRCGSTASSPSRGRPGSTRCSRWSCSPSASGRAPASWDRGVRSRRVPRAHGPLRDPPRDGGDRTGDRDRLTGRMVTAATAATQPRVGYGDGPAPGSHARRSFAARLAAGPLLFDGAMGTLLFSHGIPQRASLDELVETRPEVIGAIHRQYIAAGADAITTNTFGATGSDWSRSGWRRVPRSSTGAPRRSRARHATSPAVRSSSGAPSDRSIPRSTGRRRRIS